MNLLERFRQVKTIGDGYPIYKEAQIELREFDPDDVCPTSKYVLRTNLVRLNNVRKKIPDFLRLRDATLLDGFVVGPPIVEHDGEKDCIIDGLHRFTIAKIKGEKVTAIYIRGTDQGYPIIGKPLAWSEVKIRRVKPEDPKELRDLRVPDTSIQLRRCFRDFSFLGSTGRRPRVGQVA
tara:strand:- start:1403 stop:1936 length:534 start_codon:yes stop_codon:yes gene_type:complete